MQKQVQKLKFWAIVIGILFAIYGCNEIPNDAKEASESKSGLSFYQNPLDYLNDIRTDVGLNTLTADSTLEIAAQNHAKYVVANNEISHDETAGKINFTGITPQDRAFVAGFNSSVIENFSYNAEDMKMAIDSLMSAIYHRFGFLDFHIDSVGIGFADDNKISSYVFEMGNSNVENFCKKGVNENGFGEFVFGFCKDKKLAMQKKNFLQAQDLNFIDYVVYPNNEPALAIFNGEIPDPMPKCKILSTPVSIEFNKNAGNIEMQDFKIFNQNGDELKNEKWFEDDLKEFYPNTMLITGFDILFFWVARMFFQCEEATKKLPFHDVYLHALVKTSDGKKMSKSSGNVIDPIDKINEYSADILRFTLALLCIQGRDIRLSEEKLILVRNFTNKLYNAHKFLLLNASKFDDLNQCEIKTELGKYLLSRFNECVKCVRENLENYRFNDAATAIYKFLWDEFCDWGIELSKAEKSAITELGAIFKEAMKLLNPFMPFLSEYLYQNLSGTDLENTTSIMIDKYPQAGEINKKTDEIFSLIIEAVVSIRRAKATIDLGNSKIPLAYIKLNESINLENELEFIKLLAKCEDVKFVDEKVTDAVADVSQNLSVFVPLSGVDLSEILKRLNAQKTKLEKEILKLENMLKNEKFIANAPAEVVQTNREGLKNAKDQLSKVENEIRSLKNE